MRKIFDKAEFLLVVISTIAFELCNFSMDWWQCEEPYITVVSLVFSVAIYFCASRILNSGKNKDLVENKLTVIIVALLFLAAEIFVRLVFNKTMLEELVNEFLWLIGPVVISYGIRRFILYRRTQRILVSLQDGSQGIKPVDEAASQQIAQTYTENKSISGGYDQTCAIKTRTGTFVGIKTKNVLAFKGIPYAQQPIGERRWQPPQPLPEDDGIYEAYHYGKSAPQPVSKFVLASHYATGEDCLTLNIWQNTKNTDSGRPVILYLPISDALCGGTADDFAAGDTFVKNNPEAIFVSINYRLGIFGSLDLSEVPGAENYPDAQNLSLLDIIAATQWIRQNISAFGGDPDNMTIMGVGHGGLMALLLPLSPQGKGLFKHVVSLDSSYTFCKPQDKARQLTHALMQTYHISDLQGLLNLTTEQLTDFADRHYDLLNHAVLDGRTVPLDILKAYSDPSLDVDVIVGGACNVLSTYIAALDKQTMATYCDEKLKAMSEILPPADIDRIKQFDPKAMLNGDEGLDSKLRLMDCLYFHMPNLALCKVYGDATKRARYLYWDISSPVTAFGSFANSELLFLLGKTADAERFGVVGDSLIGSIFQRMLVNYAKNGNPSLENGAVVNVDTIPWPPYQPDSPQVMHVNSSRYLCTEHDVTSEADILAPLMKYLISG